MSPHLDLTAPYTPLVRRIESEGSVDGQILRIDHFLNHRIEPGFIFELAHELARRLSSFQPNIILTAEASGIAPALIVAQTLNVPMVYAKKYSTQVEAPALSRQIHSPTKGDNTRLAKPAPKCWAPDSSSKNASSTAANTSNRCTWRYPAWPRSSTWKTAGRSSPSHGKTKKTI